MSKVWFITGSSRGLGLAMAKAVLAAGDRLVATARKPEQLRALIAEYPERALAVELDVSNSASARAAIAQAVARFGRLDVVVNNAGYANISSIEDMPDFRAQMQRDYVAGFEECSSSVSTRCSSSACAQNITPATSSSWRSWVRSVRVALSQRARAPRVQPSRLPSASRR